MPPEGLESSVDGLGRPVRAVGVVEEREDVRHAAFEGASERDESGASGRRSPDSEGFDELGHHAPSLPTVLLRVAGDDLLVDCFASMFVRQVRQCFSVVWADGFPRCRHRFPVM